jgi:hypothetical protein
LKNSETIGKVGVIKRVFYKIKNCKNMILNVLLRIYSVLEVLKYMEESL